MILKLKQLGLSEKEAKVYLAALELGEATVQEIAKQASINRPTTYVQIERLIKLGLMSSVEKKGKMHFIAEDPIQLSKLLDEQKKEIEEKVKFFEKILPEIKSIHNLDRKKSRVRFFEGLEGLRSIKDEILKTKDKEIKAFFSVDDFNNIFSEEERNKYLNRRLKKGIKVKGLYTRSKGPFEKVTRGDDVRMIPKKDFPISSDVTIFSDKVAISALKDEIVGVIIENKEIATVFRSIFNLVWGATKK